MNRKERVSSKWSIAAAVVGLLVIAIAMFGPLSGQDARVLITQAIDETNLVTLAGNTRPEAMVRGNDRGPVPDSFAMTYMELQLKRPLWLQHQFDQFLVEQTTKGSPNYHRWITQEELGTTYGLAQQDVDAITSWLQSKGFTVDQVLPSRMVIGFSGTAGQVREAFRTEIHFLEINGEQHYANIRDQQIPAALAPAVVGVVSMHDFRPHPMAVRRPDYTFAGCTTSTLPTDPGTCYALVPGDIQTIYNVTPLLKLGLTGTGQVIAVVEDSDTYNNQGDVTTYRNTFLSKYSGTVSTVHPGTGCTDPGALNGTTGAESEANIDAEVAGITAPNATILVAACADTVTFGGLIAVQNYSSYSTKPTIFSMSYGECETLNGNAANAAFASAFSSVNASGVSVFVSAGDTGASTCAVKNSTTAPASNVAGIGVTGFGETVYNVSVGGTDFEDTYQTKFATAASGLNASTIPIATYWNSSNVTLYGSAKSYIPEIPWNGSCASWLISNYLSSSVPAFCNTSTNGGDTTYLNGQAGSGGPSGCATGGPSSVGTTGAYPTGLLSGNSCAGYAKPSWQSGIFGNPADGVRDIPDVSLFASNGWWGHDVVICFSDTANSSGGTSCAGAPSTWSGFGGTSISTPLMAGIQAAINQKWGNQGNPVSTYYAIAKTEFGSSPGNPACYSVNQLSQSRRGIASNCAFYDITQGDNAVDCYDDNCYYTSNYGVLSTQPITAISAVSPGSYTVTPTCTIAAPPNLAAYLSPTGATIYSGGTTATCTPVRTTSGTATKATGTANASTGYLPAAGQTFTIGSTTYTWVSGAPGTTANAVEIPTSATETNIAKNLEAAINATSAQCGSPSSGCFGSATTANPTVTASISSAIVTVTAITAGCGVVPFYQSAQGYYNAFNLTPTGALTPGTGAVGQICSYTLVTAGTGYGGTAGPPTCTVSGGTGSGATCTATVTESTASTPANQPAFPATHGWDFATGIGSVNAYNLVFNGAW